MRKIFAAVLIASTSIVPAQADPRGELAKEIYSTVMEQASAYRNLNSMKVMTICIEWHSPTPPPIKLHKVFITYTDIGSDGQVFPGVLRRDAMQRCEGWAARENAPCKCHVLDENGKNLLKVPKDAVPWASPHR